MLGVRVVILQLGRFAKGRLAQVHIAGVKQALLDIAFQREEVAFVDQNLHRLFGQDIDIALGHAQHEHILLAAVAVHIVVGVICDALEHDLFQSRVEFLSCNERLGFQLLQAAFHFRSGGDHLEIDLTVIGRVIFRG